MKLWAYFKHYLEDISGQLEKTDKYLTWTLFDNGRERGYTLRLSSKSYGIAEKELSFTESRNSDSIRVYPFVWDRPEDQQAELDKDYDTLTKSFSPSEKGFLYDAFMFILEYFGIPW